MSQQQRTRFDLEKAIATWRHLHVRRRVFSKQDLDELESHLRDHIAHLTACGIRELEAFDQAVQAIGDLDGGEIEYRKVRWGKLKRSGLVLHELNWKVTMLKNYLLIALRNMRRQLGYTAINVIGLALGLGLCLTIALFIKHELKYDRFLPNADNVYRLIRQNDETSPFNVAMPPGLAELLRDQTPAIKSIAKVNASARTLVSFDEKHFYIDRVLHTDAGFFDVFPYTLALGNVATALGAPNQMVLTASIAKKIFGDANPMGQTLRYDGKYDFTVTGILPDPPSHSHLRFDILRTKATEEREGPEGGIAWNYYSAAVYFALKDAAAPEDAEAQIVAIERATNDKKWLQDQVIKIEQASRVHLYTEATYGIGTKSDVRYLYLFGTIGLFLLIIACINYVNLATAQAMMRAREVGVRKAVGAEKWQLIGQFLSESVLLSILTIPLALLLALIGLPILNRLIDANIQLHPLADLELLAGLVVAAIGVGLLAGSYPAFYLARFQSSLVLKGNIPGSQRGHVAIRKMLVVFQFCASLVLITSAVVVQNQLNYIQEKDLGFNDSFVVTTSSDGVKDSYEAFKAALMQQPSVAAVSSGMPLGIGHAYLSFGETDSLGNEFSLNVVDVDYDYFEAHGIPIIDGRSFTRDFSGDADAAVILTRSAARHYINGSQSAIGQLISSKESRDGVDQMATVVGVVEDFHNESLHTAIEKAHMFRLKPKAHATLLIKLRPGSISESLAAVQGVWTEFVPERPLDVRFLDDRIAAQYRKETTLSYIFYIFACLAILVACLGLFGLAAFSAARRTKEIGIRKTLGASVTNIFALLSRDFVLLVGIAFIIATPVAYFSMQYWLEGFAYKAGIGIGVFAIAGSMALLLALASISTQALRAAQRNPVDSIRYE